MVYEIHSIKESLIPIFQGHVRISKERWPYFNYMMMFPFCSAILLVSMRA
jgi:hypothetical protein